MILSLQDQEWVSLLLWCLFVVILGIHTQYNTKNIWDNCILPCSVLENNILKVPVTFSLLIYFILLFQSIHLLLNSTNHVLIIWHGLGKYASNIHFLNFWTSRVALRLKVVKRSAGSVLQVTEDTFWRRLRDPGLLIFHLPFLKSFVWHLLQYHVRSYRGTNRGLRPANMSADVLTLLRNCPRYLFTLVTEKHLQYNHDNT